VNTENGKLAAILFLVFFACYAVSAEKAPDVDPVTGLKINPGWAVVKSNCTACHSANFIVMQRGNRETWLQMIRWMQKTQGLWQFDPNTEATILDYLATNYPPAKNGRRPNLPARDLPPNPWMPEVP